MSLRIRHLRVQDFRAFRGTHEFSFEADPDQHLELITGPNGSGKSTVIEALQLCFYGDAARDGLHAYVNQQVVDELEVDERATAEIGVELYDDIEDQLIRVFREVSTLKTPQGKKDIVEDPAIECRSKGGEWTKVSEPDEFLAELIPEETRPFAFYNPEEILGLDTWEEGESFEELVDRVRDIRNRAVHAVEMPESSAVDVSKEFLSVLNRNLAMLDDAAEVKRAEEHLILESRNNDGPLLSKGTQVLISFALTVSAGELEGIKTPLVMDMPFARADEETFHVMCDLLQQVRKRQTIIVGNSIRLDDIAEKLADGVGSIHQLSVDELGTASVERQS